MMEKQYETVIGLEVHVEPVSYTHLDVYKRQSPCTPFPGHAGK